MFRDVSSEKALKLSTALSRGRFPSIAISFYKYSAPLALKTLNKTVCVPRFSTFFISLSLSSGNNIAVFFKDRFAFVTQDKFHEFSCFRIDFPALYQNHSLFNRLVCFRINQIERTFHFRS